MSTRITKIFTFILLSLYTSAAWAQKPLDSYVADALKNNTGVREQQFQLEKALQALHEAKTLFLPSVTMLGSYTKAAGGRTIDIPIGDLLNPVYGTLNQLTNTHNFPTLENASVLLNPDNFYDVKFRTSMPLINAEVYYNKNVKKLAISLQQASANVYKRALVKDVKVAYYQYYQAEQAVAIYKEAEKLIDKNITVNESLLRNGVRTSTALTRAQTEKQKINAQITQSENTAKNAQAYFNFLLNKPFSSEIVFDSTYSPAGEMAMDLSSGDNSVSGREELQQLRLKQSMFDVNKKLQQSFIIPKLNTFVDLGSQGFNWKVNDKSAYYLFGINLEWNLFAWGQHNYKVKQAQLDINTTQLQYEGTERAFRLQLTQAMNDYNSAVSNYNSAKAQKRLAAKYYADQFKAYKEGQLLYIELIDAQNQLTIADLQLSVAFANVQIAKAETERNLTTYPLN